MYSVSTHPSPLPEGEGADLWRSCGRMCVSSLSLASLQKKHRTLFSDLFYTRMDFEFSSKIYKAKSPAHWEMAGPFAFDDLILQLQLICLDPKSRRDFLADCFAWFRDGFLLRVSRLGNAQTPGTSSWVRSRCSLHARIGVAPSTMRLTTSWGMTSLSGCWATYCA